MSRKQSDLLLICLIGALLFIPFLGKVHLFDWDEINFAESAREMIVTGDFLNVRIDYKMFWEKPPLFIWMQVASMKLFGINEFAARFPNALAGIITLMTLYLIGRHTSSRQFALMWVLIYAGSLLPHFYFKSGIIDPWFNLFIFSGIFFFIEFIKAKSRNTLWLILSALLIGLATLTKGPVALLVFLISGFVYLIINRFRLTITFGQIMLYMAVFAISGGLWFILQLLSGNYTVIQDFIVYQIRLFQTQDAGHGGFPGYHVVILLFGVFPASVLALKSLLKKTSDTQDEKLIKQWMMILFLTVLILFSIVETKIIHYSSLCYFPLTWFAALAYEKTRCGKLKPSKAISAGIIFIGSVYAIAILSFQYLIVNTHLLTQADWIKDPFAKANMQADIPQTGAEIIPAALLILTLILSFWLYRKSYSKQIISLFIGTALFINSALLFIPFQVERISQNAAIEFYNQFYGEKVLVHTYGFKSYAHLFYSGKPNDTALQLEAHTAFLGQSEVPVYAVCKIQRETDFVTNYPQANRLYDKNGFVFFEILPATP